jgi:hypothetical protein
MKFRSIAVLMIGAVLLGITSCATAPTKPPAPGEMRLISVRLPEREEVKLHYPFTVNIRFEAEGEPEIRSACFSFSWDGPHCFKPADVDYGQLGTIRVKIYTQNAGARSLKCYVLYLRDGKVQQTNEVETYLNMIQK